MFIMRYLSELKLIKIVIFLNGLGDSRASLRQISPLLPGKNIR